MGWRFQDTVNLLLHIISSYNLTGDTDICPDIQQTTLHAMLVLRVVRRPPGGAMSVVCAQYRQIALNDALPVVESLLMVCAYKSDSCVCPTMIGT